MRLWSVPKEWVGETAYLIAGGPSVRDLDLSLLRGRRVLVVNSSYQTCPWADFLFFADRRWWLEHGIGKPDKITAAGFTGRIVTSAGGITPTSRLLFVGKVASHKGLPGRADSVSSGRSSTHSAITLLVHLGVSRIVLLGVDMCRADDGRAHHHAEHPWPVKEGCWDEQTKHMKYLVAPLAERGVDVINASPVSRINWWPKKPLEECL